MNEPRKRVPFWDKVQRGTLDECWPWLGFKRPSGHGLTSLDSLMIHTSRKAWILTYGPIRGDGQCVLHKCDNPPCCNPNHLYLGTRADNMFDRFGNPSPEERAARGRPYMLTHENMDRLWEMRRNGGTLKECALEFGVHIATIGRYITAERKKRIALLRTDRLSTVRKTAV